MKKNLREKFQSGFDYTGDFYYWCGKIFDIMMLSVFWVIGSLPVITIGTSSAALYTAMCKSVRRDETPAAACFWHAYRISLKEGIVHTIVSGGLIFLFLLNFGIVRSRFQGNIQIGLMIMYLLLAAGVLIVADYIFPLISRYSMPLGWYTKTGLYTAVRFLPISVLLLILQLALYAAAYLNIFTLFFTPGIYGIISSRLLEQRVERFSPQYFDRHQEAAK